MAGAHWDDCFTHDCCRSSANPGCNDPDIEACVCEALPYCCDAVWNYECAYAIESRGCGSCGTNCGSVYVVQNGGTGWVEQQKLTASDAAPGDWFGESVAVSGDTVVVAAPGVRMGPPRMGSAYAFRFNGIDWTEAHELLGSDTVAGDGFGSDVAVSGTKAVVGASGRECAAGVNCGTAYVFQLPRLGDHDFDGDVDLFDFASFQREYPQNPAEFPSFLADITGPR